MIMTSRDEKRGAAAVELLAAEGCNVALIQVGSLDLSSLKLVAQFAADVTELHKFPRLDILVNNAGIVAPDERNVTADGLELLMATNVFGPFALTA